MLFEKTYFEEAPFCPTTTYSSVCSSEPTGSKILLLLVVDFVRSRNVLTVRTGTLSRAICTVRFPYEGAGTQLHIPEGNPVICTLSGWPYQGPFINCVTRDYGAGGKSKRTFERDAEANSKY